MVIGLHECGASETHDLGGLATHHLRQRACLGHLLPLLDESADQPHPHRLVCIEGSAAEQQFKRTMATNNTGQVGEMDRGQNARINFWLTINHTRRVLHCIIVRYQ